MVDRIVMNTGPLIALAAADALEIAGRLPLQLICPTEVQRELDAGAARGLPRIKPAWLAVVPLAAPLHPVARAILDPGEAAVIQLALEQRIDRVCIDETKGRQTALAVGLKVTGALGLLARAKTLGLISELRPLVEKMLRSGRWYDPHLIRRVLEGVGE